MDGFSLHYVKSAEGETVRPAAEPWIVSVPPPFGGGRSGDTRIGFSPSVPFLGGRSLIGPVWAKFSSQAEGL
ncbi:MAG TPA: hypothetical protein PLA90_13685 [Candidatus Sumerlaeota bacterium]|nr:hypothetical protein [Candidatus Sumerlaeota bacterium]